MYNELYIFTRTLPSPANLSTISCVNKPIAQNLRARVQVKLLITKIPERISWHDRIIYRPLQQHIYYRQQFIVQFVFFTRIPVHYFICRSCLFKWVTTDPCEHMRDSWEDTNGANKRRCAVIRGNGGSADLKPANRHETLLMSSIPSHRLYIQQVRKCTQSVTVVVRSVTFA